MVRASVVDESEGFTYLLNTWRPELSFRNYGIGGYGQANSLRVYEDIGAATPHRLVVQGVSLSTDLGDNARLAELDGDDVVVNVVAKEMDTPRNASLALKIHRALYANTTVYPLVYAIALRRFVEDHDHDQELEITRRLLERLASEARRHDADLLLLVLPGWAEVAGLDDGKQPERQRDMLAAFAAAHESVYLLDPTPELAAAGAEASYGVLDKHLSASGQFIVATTLDRWISRDWPGGPGEEPPTRAFTPHPAVRADCAEADRYRAELERPRHAAMERRAADRSPGSILIE